MREPDTRSIRRTVVLLGGMLTSAVVAFQLLSAQERPVVSNQIAVSNSEATLSLEFTDRGSVEISFRDGVVEVDGRELGSYEPGGALEDSWRTLLGRAVALSDGPLTRELVAWEPSDDLEEDAFAVASSLDRVLDEALSMPTSDREERAGAAAESAAQTIEQLRALLERSDRLGGLADALDGLDLGELTLYVGEDVTISASSEVEGTLVVVDGDLTMDGEVDGDIVVVGGSLRMNDGAVVSGDVRLVDARLLRDGGVVEGRVRNVRRDIEEIEDRIREEIRAEAEASRDSERRTGTFRPLRYVARGVGGLMQNVITLAIVMMFGLGVVYFGRERLEVVSEAARAYPGRSAMVGLAGGFLFLPVWILGMVALAVSIIGIPVLILWVPLFPLAGALAAGLGYLAIAVNVGEWLDERDIPSLDWIRSSNPVLTMLAGAGALMAPFALGHVAEMGGPFLGFLHSLLGFVGVVAFMAAISVGFGAVLLTRAGRRREYEAAMMDFDLGPRAWTRRRSRSSATVVDVDIEDVTAEADTPMSGGESADADSDAATDDGEAEGDGGDA